MEHEEAAPAGAENVTSEKIPPKNRVPCPIPPGWTVRVYRTKEVSGTEVWRGVGIRAEHECRRGFTLDLSEGPDPGPIEATLPNGERALFTEVVKLEYDEERWLRILWSPCVYRIQEWAIKYCGGEGDCRCELARRDVGDNSRSA